MTDNELRKLARESGAAVWGPYDAGQIVFENPSALQTFALRIEAKAVAEKTTPKEQLGASTRVWHTPKNCTLRFNDGRLVGLAWD